MLQKAFSRGERKNSAADIPLPKVKNYTQNVIMATFWKRQ
jgi:hypothetical protein